MSRKEAVTAASSPAVHAIVPHQLEPVFPMSTSVRGWQVMHDGTTPAHFSPDCTHQVPPRKGETGLSALSVSRSKLQQTSRRHVPLIPETQKCCHKPQADERQVGPSATLGSQVCQLSVEVNSDTTTSESIPMPLRRRAVETRAAGLSLTQYTSDVSVHLERPFNREKLGVMAATLAKKATSFMPPLSYSSTLT
jgi:hypothetical protein